MLTSIILKLALVTSPLIGPATSQESPLDGASKPAPTINRVANRSLGCSFELPSDGLAAVVGGDVDPQIRALQKDVDPPAWEIIARSIEVPIPEAGFGETPAVTPATRLAAFVADAEETNDGSIEIGERLTDLRVDELPASRLTAYLAHESGRTAQFEWTFIQTGPNRFVMIQFLADRARWPKAKFAKVMASLDIDTQPELAIGSIQLVDRGKAVIRAFDEAALRAVASKLKDGVYFRLHALESGSGAERELGFSRIIAFESVKDAVREARQPMPTTDGETGFLVWLQVRILPTTDGAPFRDVDLRAWLAWDREEEWWTIRTTVRARGSDATRTTAVTGLRPRPLPKDPRRWLQVISGGRESFERDDRKLSVPNLDTFLSEAERLVLPELLAVTAPPAGEFGIYAWNEERVSITRRLENWVPATGARRNAELVSRPVADSRPAVQKLGPDGILRERITPLGQGNAIWTKLDLEELRLLYVRKGIPFED